jgi:predicted TIM-barrel fold metal-dependent hydrolase
MKIFLLLLAASCTLITRPEIHPSATDAHMHIHTPGEDDLQFTGERALFAGLTAEQRRAIVISAGYQPGMDAKGARRENAFVAAEVAKHPTRLAGACAVNPLKDWAASELQQCRDEGLRILKLHTMASGMKLWEEAHLAKLHAILAEANRLKMTVLIHGNFPQASRGEEGLELLRELEKFPEVRYILGHLWGREYKWLEGFRHPNFFVEVSATPVWMKEPQGRQQLVETMRRVGMEKFVFGSDWPVFHPSEMVMALKALPLKDGEYKQVMFENARALDDLFLKE